MATQFKIPESVLVVLHSDAFEVLLIERADKPGFWQSVTGSRDALDEPLALTARREVFEETGIVVHPHDSALTPRESDLRDWQMTNVYEIYPVWRHRYAPGVTRNTEHRFGLRVPPGCPVRLSPHEHLAWRWLGWRDAAAACFSPSNAAAISELPRWA